MTRRIEVPPKDNSAPVRVPGMTSSQRKPSGVLGERHVSCQEPLYRLWIDTKTALELVFDDGSEISGLLVAHDTYALHLVDHEGTAMLIFKQSLRWIRPASDDAEARSGIAPV